MKNGSQLLLPFKDLHFPHIQQNDLKLSTFLCCTSRKQQSIHYQNNFYSDSLRMYFYNESCSSSWELVHMFTNGTPLLVPMTKLLKAFELNVHAKKSDHRYVLVSKSVQAAIKGSSEHWLFYLV